jgi:hypothetical protein
LGFSDLVKASDGDTPEKIAQVEIARAKIEN